MIICIESSFLRASPAERESESETHWTLRVLLYGEDLRYVSLAFVFCDNDVETYATYSLMASACAVQKMMTSLIPDKERLSSVHANNGTPSIGNRHCPSDISTTAEKRKPRCAHSRLVDAEDVEPSVERVGEDDGLEGVLFCREVRRGCCCCRGCFRVWLVGFSGRHCC